MDFVYRNPTGNKSSDYYYKLNKRGAKIYYSKITGDRVAKRDIPSSLLDKIDANDSELDISNLLVTKQYYLKEIQKLQAKISEIDIKLDQFKHYDTEELLKKKEVEEEEIRKRRHEYKQERYQQTRKFFDHLNQKYNDESQTKDPEVTLLEKHGITNKSEWKLWLIKNHQDRGGNIDLCQSIIAAGRSQGW